MLRLLLLFFLMMLCFWPLLRWSATSRLKDTARREAWEKVILAAERPKEAHVPAAKIESGGKDGQENAPAAGIRLLVFPVEGQGVESMISGFGDIRAGGKRTHEGIDIRAERGTPVLAVTNGICRKVGQGVNAGKQIWLEHENGMVFFYAHLDRHLVEEGQLVLAGEPIATVGNTGNARYTIPHLHFEALRDGREAVDPLLFLTIP